MIALGNLMTFLNDFMGYVGDKDPYMPNGLQVRGTDEVEFLAGGVSASLRLFEEAVARDAAVLLVHHGLNLPPSAILASPSARQKGGK